MFRDAATCQENHKRFISRVVATEVVWSLADKNSIAFCESNDSDRNVLLFFSDRAYAARAQASSFPEYAPQQLALFDFLFRWLPGMAGDGVLAGANWTGDLVGLEVEPADLQAAIFEAMDPKRLAVLKQEVIEMQRAEQGD